MVAGTASVMKSRGLLNHDGDVTLVERRRDPTQSKSESAQKGGKLHCGEALEGLRRLYDERFTGQVRA